jgi:hypothetical protein
VALLLEKGADANRRTEVSERFYWFVVVCSGLLWFVLVFSGLFCIFSLICSLFRSLICSGLSWIVLVCSIPLVSEFSCFRPSLMHLLKGCSDNALIVAFLIVI